MIAVANPQSSRRADKTSRFFSRSGDLFCGCGGCTEGTREAWEEIAEEVGITIDLDMVAVNHWKVAIQTHSANHPSVKHHRENLDTVDPREIVPSRRLLFLWASPECTNHSNAAGGRPKNEQSRATAWCVLRWAESLDIKNIVIENVVEFRDWGPLYNDCICGLGEDVDADQHPKTCHFMKPIKEKKGEYYRLFLYSLRKLGYRISERVLCAADYGDATSRKRLFIQARKDGRKPVWPEPTHQPKGSLNLFGITKPYRTAEEIIDWDVQGESIYTSPKYITKPLVPATMRRILMGLIDESGLPIFFPQDEAALQSYIVNNKFDATARSIKQPLATNTTSPTLYLATPYLVNNRGKSLYSSIGRPMPTETTQPHLYLAEPLLVVYRKHATVIPMDGQIPAITTSGNHVALCEFLLEMKHGGRIHKLSKPMNTLTTKPDIGLVNSFLIDYHGSHEGQTDGDRRVSSMKSPLGTIDTGNRRALIRPFMISYYGTGGPISLDDPLHTATTRDRFALICPELVHLFNDDEIIGWLDIRYRMLLARELAAAMSFPKTYIFHGTDTEQKRQIGNAVPVKTAKAICKAIFLDEIRRWKGEQKLVNEKVELRLAA